VQEGFSVWNVADAFIAEAIVKADEKRAALPAEAWADVTA
jgi:hypothetical protein